jgi:hypothetical protein
MRKKPLGGIPVPGSTIEHDFDILTRYQEFTAEILRLSLLGISAIGYLALQYPFPEKGSPTTIPEDIKTPVMLALFAFAVASIASLLHRYVSVDSLSWHLQSLRKELCCQDGDAISADDDRKKRNFGFLISRWSVIAAAGSLAVGTCMLANVFYVLTRK